MEFNKINRGPARAANTEENLYAILDAGFICHVGFQYEGQTMMIPTAYGRKEDKIFLHGSTKNLMLNQATNGQRICIAVTHLDGLVLARTLFDTSVNYRSAVLFGKAEVLTDEEERMDGLRIITENIIPGRWTEVSIGNESELKATLVVRVQIDSASAKIRQGDPKGDESIHDPVWSGVIPLSLQAGTPIQDMKFGTSLELCASVKDFALSKGMS